MVAQTWPLDKKQYGCPFSATAIRSPLCKAGDVLNAQEDEDVFMCTLRWARCNAPERSHVMTTIWDFLQSNAITTSQRDALRSYDVLNFEDYPLLKCILVSITTQYNKGTIHQGTPLNERSHKDLCRSDEYIAVKLANRKACGKRLTASFAKSYGELHVF